MNSEWKSKCEIYSILFDKMLLKHNKNMNGKSHSDIENLLLTILDTFESKIIYGDVMDGSGDRIGIIYYLINIDTINDALI
jgi:hypothetical protein